jgi:hypothetical protein
MIHPNGNEPHSTVVLDETSAPEQLEEPQEPPKPIFSKLFVTRKQQQPQQNKVVLIAGGAVAIALLLFVFSAAPSNKHSIGKGKLDTITRPAQKKPAIDDSDEQKSLFPIVESTSPKPVTGVSNDGQIGEQDLEHMAKRAPQPKVRTYPQPAYPQPAVPQVGSLGAIPPFDTGTPWQAPPYQPSSAPEPVNTTPKADREYLPSLVFVQKLVPSSTSSTGESTKASTADDISSLGLPVGTRLRARLESAASTAVSTPVTAVIEYNYESNGEIVVPAGTRVFGRVEQANRSGYLGIKFDSLLMPDEATVPIEAVATNLNLGPLRGKVEGKNSGKNVLVRSLSGMGEVASLVVGRGSVNQPISEGDLIRERIATNIGESGDQEVTRLAISEHIVVSIPANTPIYVVLEKTTKPIPEAQSARTASLNTTRASDTADSLHQLLQLQRELNQSTDVNPK